MASYFRSLMFLDCTLLLLCLMHIGADAGKCPGNVMKKAKACMAIMTPSKGRPAIIDMLASHSEGTTRDLCRQEKIQDAFSCLNKLYSSCANSKRGMKRFKMMVGIGEWRNAIDNICRSTTYLEKNAECEAKARIEYNQCSGRALAKFKQQMASLKAEEQTPSVRERYIDILCTFTSEVKRCLYDPYERYCPREMVVIVSTTFNSFTIPACAEQSRQRSVKVKYRVDGVRGAAPMDRLDEVDIVKQGDSNNNNNNHHNNNNNNNHNNHNNHKHKGYDVHVKDDKTKMAASPEEVDKSAKPGGRHSNQKPTVSVVVGNVAEVRGRGDGGKGGNSKDSGSDNDGTDGAASITFIAGSSAMLLSLTTALIMLIL